MAASFQDPQGQSEQATKDAERRCERDERQSSEKAKPKMLRNMGGFLRVARRSAVRRNVAAGFRRAPGGEGRRCSDRRRGAVGAACAALRRCGGGSRHFEPGPIPPRRRRRPPGCWRPKSSPPTTSWSPSRCAPATCTSRSPRPSGTTGIDIGFWRSESPPWRRRAGGQSPQGGVARQRQAGLRCDWLDGDEVRRALAGCRARVPGRTPRPRRRRAGSAGADARLPRRRAPPGGTLQAEKAKRSAHGTGPVTGVVTAGGTTPVEHVVLAAGVWLLRRSAGYRAPCPSSRCAARWAATRGRRLPAAICITTRANVLAAAATPSSAARWSGPGTMRAHERRLAQIFRGAVRLLPRS